MTLTTPAYNVEMRSINGKIPILYSNLRSNIFIKCDTLFEIYNLNSPKFSNLHVLTQVLFSFSHARSQTELKVVNF